MSIRGYNHCKQHGVDNCRDCELRTSAGAAYIDSLKETTDNKAPRTDCIEWIGYTMPNGYGSLPVGNTTIGVHRLAWALANGRMPKKKMDICHKCDNRKCINPDHLFEGTRSENMIDAVLKGRQVAPLKNKTHCKNGHAFNAENTKIRECGRRECIECKKARNKYWNNRNGK